MKRRRFAPHVKSARRGRFFICTRAELEAMAHEVHASPGCRGAQTPDWNEVVAAGVVDDSGHVGGILRTEPVEGGGWALVIRLAHPDAIRDGSFAAELADWDMDRGVVTESPRPEPPAGATLVASKVMTIEQVGEMRRLFSEKCTAAGELQPLDDVIVDGRVGVLMYAGPAGTDGQARVDLVYVRPDEVRP
jgi:hypothetical protein